MSGSWATRAPGEVRSSTSDENSQVGRAFISVIIVRLVRPGRDAGHRSSHDHKWPSKKSSRPYQTPIFFIPAGRRAYRDAFGLIEIMLPVISRPLITCA